VSTDGVPESFPLPGVSDVGSNWYERFPNGGTVNVSPPPASSRKSSGQIDWFRRAPNGGGTVLQSPNRVSRVKHLDGEDSH
jgi:hypothetical protein